MKTVRTKEDHQVEKARTKSEKENRIVKLTSVGNAWEARAKKDARYWQYRKLYSRPKTNTHHKTYVSPSYRNVLPGLFENVRDNVLSARSLLHNRSPWKSIGILTTPTLIWSKPTFREIWGERVSITKEVLMIQPIIRITCMRHDRALTDRLFVWPSVHLSVGLVRDVDT